MQQIEEKQTLANNCLQLAEQHQDTKSCILTQILERAVLYLLPGPMTRIPAKQPVDIKAGSNDRIRSADWTAEEYSPNDSDQSKD